jgi:putative MATE family efflux protein
MMLNGDINRAVLAVALPSVATMLLQTTNTLLDRGFVGRLGAEALAAVTMSTSLMFAMMSAAMAIATGTTAMVARFVGEGNTEDAITATRQSLLLGLVISVAVGLPMFFLRGIILQALGMDAEALPLAKAYLGITVLGMPSLFLMLILNGAFRGLGDTVRPFWVSLAANVVHIGVNWLLIFGNLGAPKMGLPGGAVGLITSQVLSMALYAAWMRKTPLASALHGPWFFDLAWARRIAKIGIPAAAQQLLRVGSLLMFQSLLAYSPAKAAAVAALGVGLSSESIAFMPGFGYSIAASAFVGQNLGAGKPDRAEKGAWIATWQAVAVMSLMGLVFFSFAEPFAHFFIKHTDGETPLKAAQTEEAIRLTIAYLKIALISEPFLALGMVLTGALQGAGETSGPTKITFVTMVLLRFPVAWFLIYHTPFGVLGGWWAMTLSTVASGLATAYLFRKGDWRRVEV